MINIKIFTHFKHDKSQSYQISKLTHFIKIFSRTLVYRKGSSGGGGGRKEQACKSDKDLPGQSS